MAGSWTNHLAFSGVCILDSAYCLTVRHDHPISRKIIIINITTQAISALSRLPNCRFSQSIIHSPFHPPSRSNEKPYLDVCWPGRNNRLNLMCASTLHDPPRPYQQRTRDATHAYSTPILISLLNPTTTSSHDLNPLRPSIEGGRLPIYSISRAIPRVDRPTMKVF